MKIRRPEQLSPDERTRWDHRMARKFGPPREPPKPELVFRAFVCPHPEVAWIEEGIGDTPEARARNLVTWCPLCSGKPDERASAVLRWARTVEGGALHAWRAASALALRREEAERLFDLLARRGDVVSAGRIALRVEGVEERVHLPTWRIVP